MASSRPLISDANYNDVLIAVDWSSLKEKSIVNYLAIGYVTLYHEDSKDHEDSKYDGKISYFETANSVHKCCGFAELPLAQTKPDI